MSVVGTLASNSASAVGMFSISYRYFPLNLIKFTSNRYLSRA